MTMIMMMVVVLMMVLMMVVIMMMIMMMVVMMMMVMMMMVMMMVVMMMMIMMMVVIMMVVVVLMMVLMMMMQGWPRGEAGRRFMEDEDVQTGGELDNRGIRDACSTADIFIHFHPFCPLSSTSIHLRPPASTFIHFLGPFFGDIFWSFQHLIFCLYPAVSGS